MIYKFKNLSETVKITCTLVLIFISGMVVKEFKLLDLFISKSEFKTIGESVKDFGIITSDKKAIHYFKFINSGSKELIISNIETRCGCTISNWNKNPIKSKETDSIKIEYDTKIIGPFNRTIAVYSNSDSQPSYFHIRGIVKD